MTLEQLRIFLAVAEREHVTRAAEALGLTQSAVSAAIRALEARHGIALFHRVGRHIELSEAGRLFRAEAEAVLARARAAELVLSELGGVGRGTLAVQASQTVVSYWLPPLLVRFRALHPGVQVQVTAGNTTSVVQALMDGVTELGFVEGEVAERALVQFPLTTDQLIVVVGLEHPWAGQGPVAPDRLTETAWIMREAGSGTRAAFELLSPGLEVALELPSNEAVLAAVEAGGGAAVVSERAAAPHLAAGLVARAGVELPPRSFKALRHRERQGSGAARALLSLAQGG
jgi:DNA-binding transcriptional LysR family regulator